jgi:hypothetical protein
MNDFCGIKNIIPHLHSPTGHAIDTAPLVLGINNHDSQVLAPKVRNH